MIQPSSSSLCAFSILQLDYVPSFPLQRNVLMAPKTNISPAGAKTAHVGTKKRSVQVNPSRGEAQRIYKKHACTEEGCAYATTRACDLKRHSKTHAENFNGEDRIPCSHPECSRTFNQKSSLLVHLNWHKGSLPYGCPVVGCNAAFGDKTSYTKHVGSKHPGQCELARSKCDECSWEYLRLDAFRRHWRSHHHGKPFPDLTRRPRGSVYLSVPPAKMDNERQRQTKEASSSSRSNGDATPDAQLPLPNSIDGTFVGDSQGPQISRGPPEFAPQVDLPTHELFQPYIESGHSAASYNPPQMHFEPPAVLGYNYPTHGAILIQQPYMGYPTGAPMQQANYQPSVPMAYGDPANIYIQAPAQYPYPPYSYSPAFAY